MERRGESTHERSFGLCLVRLPFWLPVAILLYVLSIGPAIRFGANHSDLAIRFYRPVGWACHQSRLFERLVTGWVKIWDRGPVPLGAPRYGANFRLSRRADCVCLCICESVAARGSASS
jgi:hypothetical protein